MAKKGLSGGRECASRTAALEICGRGAGCVFHTLLFLFLQAWAVFKGKFKEGDKAEPATWKTRLRCALNKSPDFEEVTDRSQLDISEPYKVYRIVPEEEQKCNYPRWALSPTEAAQPAAAKGEPGPREEREPTGSATSGFR